jgi:hypothetical protein
MIHLQGPVVLASTRRTLKAQVTPGQTSAGAIHLTNLKCYAFMGILIQPTQQQTILDLFNVGAEQPGVVFAEYPEGTGEAWPIKPNDRLILPDGTYRVIDAMNYPGSHIEIYIEVAIKQSADEA